MDKGRQIFSVEKRKEDYCIICRKDKNADKYTWDKQEEDLFAENSDYQIRPYDGPTDMGCYVVTVSNEGDSIYSFNEKPICEECANNLYKAMDIINKQKLMGVKIV